MSINCNGITDYKISKKEFELLKYLSPELYLESSIGRFQEWSSSFDTKHPDWKFRINVQKSLAKLVASNINFSYSENKKLSIIFVGASLGSISTYFHLGELTKIMDLNNIELTILDLLETPLKRTIAGDFEFNEDAEKDCGYSEFFSAKDYKVKLSSSKYIATDASIDLDIGNYDIVISPYLQHHMNIFGKEKACSQLEKMSKKGGVIAVGDLTFEYEDFVKWLKQHECESVPYSIESFITKEKHISFFKSSSYISDISENNFYSFLMIKQ